MRKHLKTFAIVTMAFFTFSIFSGCTTRSRSYDKPIEGQYRTYVEYSESKGGTKLAYKTETDYYVYLGFLQDYNKSVLRQQKMESHYLGGADSDCPTMVVATFGILLVIDFLMYTLQFGTDDTMCFAQLIDTDPSTTWSRGTPNGQSFNYSRPYSGTIYFYHGNNRLPAKREGSGLWSIRKTELPSEARVDRYDAKSSKFYFK